MDKRTFYHYLIIIAGAFVLASVFDNIILNWIAGFFGWAVLLGGTPIVWMIANEKWKSRKENIRFVQLIWLVQFLFIILILKNICF